jgi:predicted O-methyltransferase YrrM
VVSTEEEEIMAEINLMGLTIFLVEIVCVVCEHREHFTTKPFYDKGEIRRIGEIVTPWPCFLLCSRLEVLNDPAKRPLIERMFTAIQSSCTEFSTAPSPWIETEIAKRYGLRVEDAKSWYSSVHITASQTVMESTIETSLLALRDAGILTEENYPAAKHKQVDAFIDAGLAHLEADIKSMRLYHKPEMLTALYNNIRVRMGREKGKINWRELLKFDQNHYDALNALNIAIEKCGLGGVSDSDKLAALSGRKAISLGSSVGGPARYLAGAAGAEVLAVELQDDLHIAGKELTSRTGLDSRVTHVGGNFLQVVRHLGTDSYDAILSWLTILHFTQGERVTLFKDCLRVLKPGGTFYAEDFFELAPCTPAEKKTLRHDVFVRVSDERTQQRSRMHLVLLTSRVV